MNPADGRAIILIVEDDASMLQYYSFALHNEYIVLAAANGKDALGLLRTNQAISLAIIDYRLPDMSGIDILKEMKKTRPSVPVILITAYGDEDVAVNAFRCGAKDYMKKPIDYLELIAKIEFYLSLPSPDGPSRMTLNHEVTANQPLPSANPRYSFINLQRAIQFIKEEYASTITVPEIAAMACLSERHFRRVFKKEFGTSCQDYLNQCRVDKAKEMLRDTKWSITEIAVSVGYNDLTNFIRIFKKKTNLTPSDFKSPKNGRKSR